MPAPLGGLGFQQGQHVCSLYHSREEQQRVALAYVAEGLRKNERCLYVADTDAALDQFREQLGATGADGFAAESTGALLLLTHAEAHLAGGRFDTERMLSMLNAAVEEALNAGFDGLRTCGDMSWLLKDPEGAEQVVVYEALLNQFFRHTRALGMCQYDLKRLPHGLLDHAGIETHTSVVIDARHRQNPFYAAGPAPHSKAFHAKVTSLRHEERDV